MRERERARCHAYRMPESHPTASKAQGHADDEPDAQNDEHGGEGDRPARLLCPQEQVKQEEGGEHNAGHHGGRQGDVSLPGFAAESLVDARGHVTSDEAEDGVQQDHDCAERTPVGGGQEAQQGKSDGRAHHDEKLRASAQENAEK